MKAGKELDALIAETVFGCYVSKVNYGEYYFCACDDPENPNYVQGAGQPHNGKPIRGFWTRTDRQEIKPYSTDISAAWEVVERMTGKLDLKKEGIFVKGPDVNGMWCAEIKGARFWTKSVPHSICLAALKAVGHKF